MTVSIFGAKSYEIYELSSSTKAAQTKGATQLEKVSEFITFNNEKFEEFEVDRKQKENEIAELKEDLAFLKEKFIEVDKNLYPQKRYSGRNCHLVHGVDEKYNEDPNQAITSIIKMIWERKLLIHYIIYVTEKNVLFFLTITPKHTFFLLNNLYFPKYLFLRRIQTRGRRGESTE